MGSLTAIDRAIVEYDDQRLLGGMLADQEFQKSHELDIRPGMTGRAEIAGE